MKKIFIATIVLFSLVASAQMSLKKLDGTPINNGDVFVYDVAVDPGSYLGFKIYNDSPNPINVKVKVESITNADGTNVQLCLGDVCLPEIIAGNSYPPSFPAIIEGNSENGNFDHFLNLNSGIDLSQAVAYSFKFFQLNDLGAEIGNSVSFSYRYVSPLGVSDFSALAQAGIQLKSNVISSNLEMMLDKDIEFVLYDVTGKSVLSRRAEIGMHSVDVSNLNAGVYIMSYTNKKGQSGSTRIIKR
jgi:hypothetical protein